MKNPLLKRAAQKGQAIVLIAVLMVVLIASLGLAIDGGGMFFLYRDLQNATDAAALSAAFALCSDGDPVSAGERNALLNGWEDDLPNNIDVDVQWPPTEGPFAGTANEDNYVRVEITAEKPSYFIQVVYPGPLVVSANTTSQCDPGFSAPWPAGSAIITLGPGCAAGNGNQGNIANSGNGSLTTVGGGIASNSSGCQGGALDAAGNGNITAGGYGACTQGGSFENNGNGTISGSQSTSCPTPQITDSDPLFNNGILVPPTCPAGSNTLQDGTNYPGTYTSFDTSPSDVAELEPGIYCIKDDSVRWQGRLTMDTCTGCDGVFLFFEFTDEARILSDGTTNLIGISDSGSPYNGFVIWMHELPAYNITNSSVLDISAGASSNLRGTVYAPTKHCNLAGGDNPSTIYGQFICYSFNANGNGDMTIVYEDAAIADDPATFGVTE